LGEIVKAPEIELVDIELEDDE